ncbi:RidA family protein [Saliphagus infecundisoli]|uniref:RidA family protein n=1 Tax=Saliphagus infecundisoli TaxID=1849069 RepID=A0ABD5QG90_9EURY|nr:RidA family protein [Saliphagus infecundisoli]
MDRTEIHPDGLADSRPHHFTPATVADGRLYVSGQVGVTADGEPAGDDVASQSRQAFANVETLLADVGSGYGLDDVIKLTSYLVDVRRTYEPFHAVYREVFLAEPYPCHTVLGVDGLPTEALLVELEVEVPLG